MNKYSKVQTTKSRIHAAQRAAQRLGLWFTNKDIDEITERCRDAVKKKNQHDRFVDGALITHIQWGSYLFRAVYDPENDVLKTVLHADKEYALRKGFTKKWDALKEDKTKEGKARDAKRAYAKKILKRLTKTIDECEHHITTTITVDSILDSISDENAKCKKCKKQLGEWYERDIVLSPGFDKKRSLISKNFKMVCRDCDGVFEEELTSKKEKSRNEKKKDILIKFSLFLRVEANNEGEKYKVSASRLRELVFNETNCFFCNTSLGDYTQRQIQRNFPLDGYVTDNMVATCLDCNTIDFVDVRIDDD